MTRFVESVVIVLLGATFSSTLTAQSTSSWQKIGPPSIGLTTAPPPGEGYMTVAIKSATVYQNSGWWTAFVERNRQAVLTANLSATINNVAVTQTVTGNTVALNKNKSLVDLGFSGILVDSLPTTFSGMNVNIQINKTAQDGLQGLISQVSSLSTATPPVLAISAQTMQITSFAKSVADFLFKANLLVSKAQTKNPFPISGALDPGVYVCFAGDQQSDYQGYLENASTLKWNGALLTSGGQPVANVSFFIIEVDYKSQYFADPLDALNFGASKPWVTLYLTAQQEIPKINTAADAASTQKDIQSHVFDATTLLYQDYSFTNAERDAISTAVYKKLNTAYQQRILSLGIASSPAPTQTTQATNAPTVQNPTQPATTQTTPSQPGVQIPTVPPIVSPVLMVPNPADLFEHEQIVQSLGVGNVMHPTSQF